MKMENKKLDSKRILLLADDLIILLLNIVICIFLFNISNKEKKYRGSTKLYVFQIILSFIIIVLDIVLNIKNIISNYKGHNRFGMLLRFFIFYCIIPCIILTYQRSNNLNHDDIKNIGNILFYMGCVNEGLIIISMILSFLVIDTQKEEKILVHKHKRDINMSSVENMKLLEESNTSSQIFRELEKKED